MTSPPTPSHPHQLPALTSLTELLRPPFLLPRSVLLAPSLPERARPRLPVTVARLTRGRDLHWPVGREEGEVGGVEVGGVSLEGLVEITVFIWK